MKTRPKLRYFLTDTCLPIAALLAFSLYSIAAWAWLGYTIIQHITR